jgi:hypothetical protein
MGICLSRLGLAAALLFGLAAMPAEAQVLTPGTVAEPGTPEYVAGDAILFFVNGQTLKEVGGPAFNPYSIDGDMLLFTVGSFFVVTDFDGTPVHEGEFSILPMYQMPRLFGSPSAETPPIIPFAFQQNGVCHGGYVAGYPVPDTTYAVDMTGALCHADTVDEMVVQVYAAASTTTVPATEPAPEETIVAEPPAPGFDPAFSSDLDLENAVYYAYGVAYGAAMSDPDYAFWDGSDFTTLRDKIVTELGTYGFGSVAVSAKPSANAAASKTCAPTGTTELRIAFTRDKLGVAITAASDRRYYSYEYDAAVSADLRITAARDCATSGPGRAQSRSH